jgi:SAM-dependent methyltransferase
MSVSQTVSRAHPRPGKPFNRASFIQAVHKYMPLPFEVVQGTQTRRFRTPMNHVLKNRDRFYIALSVAFPYFPPRAFTLIDIGAYPGSLLRLLRHFLPPERCRLIGTGLMISDDFRNAMLEACGAKILTANLDPRNDQLRGKGYPTQIPLDDGSVDFAFALEIVEHMVSPVHIFSEAFRALKPGGHLLITTPNVTRIGNVFKLMVGRSNFDRLIPIDYWNEDDEWRPHFREYTLPEIADLFRRAGFEVVEQRQYIGEDTHENVKSVQQRLIDLAKIPFYVVPHFRGSLLAVGRKPNEG